MLALACAVSAMSLLPGCSYLFSQGPPPDHRELNHIECSTHYAPPVVDTVWATLNGLGMVNALTTPDDKWTSSVNQSTVIAYSLVWLALSGSSAFYGYSKVGECRDARMELMVRSRYPAPRQNETRRQNEWLDREGASPRSPSPPRDWGRPRPPSPPEHEDVPPAQEAPAQEPAPRSTGDPTPAAPATP
jgi:hypothetical protein